MDPVVRAANPFFGRSSSGRSPAQLGFDYWWDAGQGVTESSGVSVWTDRIGSKTLSGVIGNRPTLNTADAAFNGVNSIEFDGASQLLTSDDTAAFWDFFHRSDKASTVLMVLRVENAATGGILGSASNVGVHGAYFAIDTSGATYVVRNTTTVSTASETAAAFGTTGSYFSICTHDASNVTVEKGTRGAGSNSVANSSTSTASPEHTMKIGFIAPSSDTIFALAHLAFKTSALSAAEISSAKRWCNQFLT